MGLFSKLKKEEAKKQEKLDTVGDALFEGLNLVDDDPNKQLYDEFEEQEDDDV